MKSCRQPLGRHISHRPCNFGWIPGIRSAKDAECSPEEYWSVCGRILRYSPSVQNRPGISAPSEKAASDASASTCKVQFLPLPRSPPLGDDTTCACYPARRPPLILALGGYLGRDAFHDYRAICYFASGVQIDVCGLFLHVPHSLRPFRITGTLALFSIVAR